MRPGFKHFFHTVCTCTHCTDYIVCTLAECSLYGLYLCFVRVVQYTDSIYSLYTGLYFEFFGHCKLAVLFLEFVRILFRVCILAVYTVRILFGVCTLYGLHLQFVYCRALSRILSASVQSLYTVCTLYGFCLEFVHFTNYRHIFLLVVQCTLYGLHSQFVYCRALFRIFTASVKSFYTGCTLYGLCLQFVPCTDSVKGLYIINRENVYFIMLQ